MLETEVDRGVEGRQGKTHGIEAKSDLLLRTFAYFEELDLFFEG
jgi:hypothetical protein